MDEPPSIRNGPPNDRIEPPQGSPSEAPDAAFSDEFRHLRPHQQLFLTAFMATFRVTTAAAQAGIARDSHYGWLAQDEKYRAAFQRARLVASDVLEDEAVRRAMEGSDGLLMFLLRGLRPEQYGHSPKMTIGSLPAQTNNVTGGVMSLDPKRAAEVEARRAEIRAAFGVPDPRARQIEAKPAANEGGTGSNGDKRAYSPS